MTVTFYSWADTIYDSGSGGGGSEEGSISVWSGLKTYAVNDWVTYSGAIWVNRTAGSNITPSLSTNDWRQVANVDTANECLFVGSIITTASYSLPKGQTSAQFDTTTNNITVTMPSIASLSNSDTNNKTQLFRVVKRSPTNKLVINLASGDTFLDGTTSWTLNAQSLYSFYAIYQSTNWTKG